ncbi:pectinesterase family protein [Flavobacterium sp.]|uniref:pectinesterase family protein n=1 Tax=Flavobacterium sp. TaxID=239 RepID=UPI002CE78A1C|nr:pectinesterase family protein [Flavobacterium sp.]HSD07349.1 pectinesterase family protein [Flavobacterium sp.]
MKNPILKLVLLLAFLTANTSFAKNYKDKYDIIVAADGSGHYTSVQEAFNAVKDNNPERTVIFVKAGTYKEKLTLVSSKKNVTLIGESYKNTILTFDDCSAKVNGTDKSFSVLIAADDFIAENITFENTIDHRLDQYKTNGQGVALMLTGDRNIFHKCKITGFQDTFFLKDNKRTYVKDCIIDGTTDFIFGAGIALFENCLIRVRKDSHITANNQLVDKNKYGFVFKDCAIIRYPGEIVSSVTLGRPWGDGSRVVYLFCYEGSSIKSDGWGVWTKDETKKGFDNWKTSYYAEYNCYGPGYKPKTRLPWTHILSYNESVLYNKEKIFAANTTSAIKLEGDWNPHIKGDKCDSILPDRDEDEIKVEASFLKKIF